MDVMKITELKSWPGINGVFVLEVIESNLWGNVLKFGLKLKSDAGPAHQQELMPLYATVARFKSRQDLHLHANVRRLPLALWPRSQKRQLACVPLHPLCALRYSG